jgi:DUF1680 family protein
VRWMQDGAQVSLQQQGEYPFDAHVQIEIAASKPIEFGVNLRIPSWAEQASVSVNRKREAVAAGGFATVQRRWKNGDRIDVELPLAARLESIDPRHANTVALMSGPLVLFAIADSNPSVTRSQLLAAKKRDGKSWQVESAAGAFQMLPFMEIREQQYATYLRVS